MRSLISVHFEYSLKEIILEQVAYSIAELDHLNFILEFLGPYYGAELLGFDLLVVMVFQLSCILPIILNRFFMLYGFLALLFHLSTGIVLSIYYHPTPLSCLFFLILTEYMLKYEKIGKSPR